MKKNMLTKGLVFLIIILLTGVSVQPIIGGFNNKLGEKLTNNYFLNDSPGEKWNKTYGGEYFDRGKSVQQTDDGGYIIVGYTESFGAGSRDIWLIKTDANGNMQWNKTFGDNSYDVGYSVQQTYDSGYIIGCDSDHCFRLIKTDSQGNIQWNNTYWGWDGVSYGREARQTTDGGYIQVGSTELYSAGLFDIWLIKTDSNGSEIWNNTYGGIEEDYGFSVKQTYDDGFIIVGNTCSFGAGSSDIWLIKTDANGNMQWNKTFGDIDGDSGTSVVQTVDGGYILTGTGRYYLIKTDGNGDMEWYKTDGDAYSIQQTSDEGYILTGGFGYGPMTDVWLVKYRQKGAPIGLFTWSPENPAGWGEIVTFDASDSYDPDGTIVSYEWDFDNDGQFDDATGVNPSWQWFSSGYYSVLLNVTDNEGKNDITMKNIFVTPPLPDEVWVDDDYDNSTPGWGVDHFNCIKDGINFINKSGIIYVYNGSYFENLVIEKGDFEIIGENRETTIIDGGGKGALSIRASNINISGFSIQNFNQYAIHFLSGQNNTISNNIFMNNNEGIKIEENADYSTISNNIFIDHIRAVIDLQGHNNVISGNLITKESLEYACRTGITIDAHESPGLDMNNIISGNIITYCWETGIAWSDFADQITVTQNVIENCTWGLVIAESEYLTISLNTIDNCGIGIVGVISFYNTVFSQNNITNCLYGIYIHTLADILLDLEPPVMPPYEKSMITKCWTIMINQQNAMMFKSGFGPLGRTVIEKNNFFGNDRHASFRLPVFGYSIVFWNNNYWEKPRSSPYFIFGKVLLIIPWIHLDLNPAKQPYDIPKVSI